MSNDMMNDDSSVGSFASDAGISTATSSGGNAESNSDDSIGLAKGETRVVNMLRAVVAFVLIMATIGASFAVYRYTSNDEHTQFEQAFLSHGTKIVESLKTNVEKQLATMDTFGISCTTLASHQNNNSKYPNRMPFVTIPSFERRVHSALAQIKGLSFLIRVHVEKEDRELWEQYAVENFQVWSQESIDFIKGGGYNVTYQNVTDDEGYEAFPEMDEPARRRLQAEEGQPVEPVEIVNGVSKHIHTYGPNWTRISDPSPGPYLVSWQNTPHIFPGWENGNHISMPDAGFKVAYDLNKASLGATTNVEVPTNATAGLAQAITALIVRWGIQAEVGQDPVGSLVYPIMESENGEEPKIKGVITMYTHWRSLFLNLLPESAVGIDAVFSTTCGGNFTYQVNGANAVYRGAGDLHNPKYDHLEQRVNVVDAFNERLATGTQYKGVPLSKHNCDYTLHVYPSDILKDEFVTNSPWFYTAGVIAIFLFAGLVFALYDYTVESRQRVVMRNALKTNAIVSSLFPAQIANRLIEKEEVNLPGSKKGSYTSNKQRIKTFLNDGANGCDEDQPMADLFPATTVMIADLVNFTAWASTRDPSQVFTLLQTLYGAFDKIAAKRKVFKVETIGDSYVAVTGLPEKQDDHALRMARFALDCLAKVHILTKELEVKLGPDTGDLAMRFGLHSGPCTAGVLRGERARFQLFGDTINMAARMEGSSLPNRVHISKATANFLIDMGRGEMVTKRQEAIHIKGKGMVESYFLVSARQNSMASSVGSGNHLSRQTKSEMRKTQRLVEWNVKILAGHLQKVVARRQAVKGQKAKSGRDITLTNKDRAGKTCLEELEDIIEMPAFDPKIAEKEANPATIDLGPQVMEQLKTFVAQIADRYHRNPFHNFDHASHVSMSVDKMLTRIITPDIEVENSGVDLHDFSHGITSDPLIHFGVVLSALIHDADHRGVSNMQLAKEEPHLAELYKNKSIAEQNSCDVAWELLMAPDMKDLRGCIYSDKEELHRFRQTLLKVVLATDIFDKELNDLRKQRWQMAFTAPAESPKKASEEVNVKATIVIEHLIQASDVSHTMQHWHIYRKWNECLFKEMYEAYLAGRMGKDPATFWYKGELGFFDNYIIPLTKKLKECNVFGVSSAEYLSYAVANREEWEQKGEEIVAQMVETYRSTTIIEEGDEEEEEESVSEETSSSEGDGAWNSGAPHHGELLEEFSDEISV